MLAVPGALIALGLAYLAGLGTVERDRRELALLRARGGVAARAAHARCGRESRRRAQSPACSVPAVRSSPSGGLVSGGVGLTTGRAVATVGLCVGVAAAGALAARLGAAWPPCAARSARVDAASRRERRPLWLRLYLDLIALAVSGLIYWLTARTGFSAVVNPDSNPTLSLSVYMFFAPALLWLGATLLLVRLRGRFLAWLADARSGEPRDDDRAGFCSQARAGAGRPSTEDSWSSGSCSPSGSTSASSRPPTISRRGSTRS